MEASVIFNFPYQTNGNHATEPSTVSHIKLRTALERYFQFHRIVNNYRLRQGTVYDLVKLFSQFFLKLYTQI